MKKSVIAAIVSLILIQLSVISCRQRKTPVVKEKFQDYSQMEAIDSPDQATVQLAEDENTPKADIDFTKLNFNMASAEIFNIMLDPGLFIGKTVYIKGKFFTSQSKFGRTYAVLYYDATACCQTGLPFILRGDYKYPQDYPKQMDDIKIYGTIRVASIEDLDYIYIDTDSYSY